MSYMQTLQKDIAIEIKSVFMFLCNKDNVDYTNFTFVIPRNLCETKIGKKNNFRKRS